MEGFNLVLSPFWEEGGGAVCSSRGILGCSYFQQRFWVSVPLSLRRVNEMEELGVLVEHTHLQMLQCESDIGFQLSCLGDSHSVWGRWCRWTGTGLCIGGGGE